MKEVKCYDNKSQQCANLQLKENLFVAEIQVASKQLNSFTGFPISLKNMLIYLHSWITHGYILFETFLFVTIGFC